MDKLNRQVYLSYVATHHGYADSAAAGVSKGGILALQHFIQTYLPQDRSARILEVGCGGGDLVNEALKQGYTNIRGVDFAPPQVERALAQGLPVIQADGVDHLAGLEPNSLDVIIAYDVIEHLPRDALYDFCVSAYRALKPKGRVIVRVPNGVSPFAARSRYFDITHFTAFTPNSLSQLFKSFGFLAIKAYEEPPRAHGLKSFVRLLIWRICAGFFRLFLVAETGSTTGHPMSLNIVAVVEK